MRAADYGLTEVTDDEMRWVYDNHMSKPTGGARDHYDRLVASATFELCSYCQYGHAKTLDHFVPQSIIGGLAVEPWNLVPACHQCNHKLGDYVATESTTELFHPFFESVESRWLYARVIEKGSGALEFFAAPAADLEEDERARISNQFKTLGLAFLFSSVSGKDIAEARESLRGTPPRPDDEEAEREAREADPRIVAGHSAEVASALLAETAAIAFRVDANSRRGVVYEALAGSAWFCSLGA
ncbi:HNH endonuclease [Microbacterium sp. kSW2-24]|uniref:HNH endonuclease n=1 Tax=Microbacterium galbinum TaxID=2851646 RepID=UPI001FFC8AF4|nr:HNH endonuclease [Microbacterium galbinum]MCK2024360.1 HNH endonuclease [Microbacterium galbinum]